MGLYRYEAVDNTGKVVRGAMDVRDENHLAQKLAQMGYTAKAIYPPSGAHRTATAIGVTRHPTPATTPTSTPVSVQSLVKPRSLATFFRQLAMLVKSGRPLFQSSTDLVVRDLRLRKILPLIQEHVQSGKSLSGSMAAFPEIFPVHATASVWAGEIAGKLEIALDEVASEFEQISSEYRFAIIGRFLGKLSLISLIFAIPASNLANMLLPGLQAALNDPNMDSKQVLMEICRNYMQTTFWKSVIISILIIIGWIVWGRLKRIPGVKQALDRQCLNAPIWGKLHRYRALSRFTHVLDGLYSAGIAPAAAWDAASLTPQNSEIAKKLRSAKTIAPPNANTAELFAAAGVFDVEDVGIASSGEKAGSLPDAMANIAATYADKAAAQRTICRSWSVGLLIWFSIILTGYIMVNMALGYIDLIFKAADLMGK